MYATTSTWSAKRYLSSASTAFSSFANRDSRRIESTILYEPVEAEDMDVICEQYTAAAAADAPANICDDPPCGDSAVATLLDTIVPT